MEFGKALTYPFEDEEWLSKLGLGLVVGLVPIVNFALLGWTIKIIQNVRRGEAKPLPAWDDFGGHFMRGLLSAVAAFIYELPYIVFIGVGAGAQAAAAAAAASSGDDGGALAVIGTVVFACCACLALLYLVVAMLALFGGLMRFSETETFGTFMEFGTNFGLVRENLGKFVMALIYIFLAQLLFMLAATVTLGLGGLLVPVVLSYFVGHLLGQLSQQLQLGGEPAAV